MFFKCVSTSDECGVLYLTYIQKLVV